MRGYREWLIARLEQFREPVDLIGHDWGGAHVVQVAMERPDLIRSWASDALGVYAPGYVWHKLAQARQQEGPGEALAKELFADTLEERLAVVANLGMTGPAAEWVAAGMDDGKGRRCCPCCARRRSRSWPTPAAVSRGRTAGRGWR